MALHACVSNNVVEKIVDITSEEHYQELSQQYLIVISIEDLLIKPDVGWVLQGNDFVPGPEQSVSLEEMIKSRIKFYQEEAPELLRDLYTANTLLGITTQQSDQMFEDYQDVLIRIREGAWPTALYRLSQKQPSGFVTQEMIEAWSTTIAARMA